jgi:hypothetical protein
MAGADERSTARKSLKCEDRNSTMADKDARQLIREAVQPKGRISGAQPRFLDGGKRSVAVLKNLKFDPIGALVEQYNKLQKEVEWHEKVRSGELIPLSRTGKELRYDSEAHMASYNLLVQIGDKLLRYGYGRVPENAEAGPQRNTSLTINLTDKDKQFIVNSDTQPDYIEGELGDE